VRTGSNRSPRASPASAPNVTGVYGIGMSCARLRDRLAEPRGDEAERVQVRRLALVRRHADGRVALHVLDGTEAFLRREREVGAVTSFWKSTKAFRASGR
jgi:hypothetical protein